MCMVSACSIWQPFMARPGGLGAGGAEASDLRVAELLLDAQAALSKLLLEANANPNVTDRYAQTPIFFAPTRRLGNRKRSEERSQ